MKSLILLLALVMLVMILANLPVSAKPDTSTSLADSNIPDNRTTTSQTEASNSSVSGVIMITMIGILDE